MTQQADDHPIGSNSGVLSYARPGTEKAPRSVPVSGVVAFVVMIAQISWAIAVAPILWAERRHFQIAGTLPLSWKIVFWLVVFLPLIVGQICGCHSVIVGGISWRNRFGVIGLAPAVAIGVVSMIRSPILGLPLISMVLMAWRLHTIQQR